MVRSLGHVALPLVMVLNQSAGSAHKLLSFPPVVDFQNVSKLPTNLSLFAVLERLFDVAITDCHFLSLSFGKEFPFRAAYSTGTKKPVKRYLLDGLMFLQCGQILKHSDLCFPARYRTPRSAVIFNHDSPVAIQVCPLLKQSVIVSHPMLPSERLEAYFYGNLCEFRLEFANLFVSMLNIGESLSDVLSSTAYEESESLQPASFVILHSADDNVGPVEKVSHGRFSSAMVWQVKS
ncbi:hypothetical protein [Pseudomonas phage pPA-3099-2aT.2]|uniref:Uncharacterized protein n=1 Tax=Pseudomonas phage pPA-3099-2aT.2 TaxID=3003808 RepID=A0AAE9W525_9CAUD|nr:hypothetical protein QE325_gp123 [Pseudomonas phage pPA-3099-2aT.2]WBQ35258.1 hypothetical protein [Pseudomonas phage pPA-3099-2aT.2]